MVLWRILWCHKPEPDERGQTWTYEGFVHAPTKDAALASAEAHALTRTYRKRIAFMALDVRCGKPGEHWCKVHMRFRSDSCEEGRCPQCWEAGK